MRNNASDTGLNSSGESAAISSGAPHSDHGVERATEPQRSFDLPPAQQTAPSETPRTESFSEPRAGESAPPPPSKPDASPQFHSNQSFHFEPSKPTGDGGKTYTVWSSGSGGASRRDE
ncbi:MAG TPA: hypothetical protein VET48_02335 [Steroidobacteraceae bacterium]|nr:hypothetical protein [Steroidobacteraceae bacterium]